MSSAITTILAQENNGSSSLEKILFPGRDRMRRGNPLADLEERHPRSAGNSLRLRVVRFPVRSAVVLR